MAKAFFSISAGLGRRKRLDERLELRTKSVPIYASKIDKCFSGSWTGGIVGEANGDGKVVRSQGRFHRPTHRQGKIGGYETDIRRRGALVVVCALR